MEQIYELHADLCKVFSNAVRLEIINTLRDKEMSARELIERIGLSKANLSQHMSVLKLKGVILTRREGVNIYYRIANPKIIQACQLIREVLLEQFQEKGRWSRVSGELNETFIRESLDDCQFMKRTPKLISILMSVHGDELSKQEAMKAGIHGYLGKPLDFRRLQQAVGGGNPSLDERR